MGATLHPGLRAQRWQALHVHWQLGNVGSEVARALHAKAADDPARMALALTRALELLDLTLADERWRGPRRREIAPARDVVCD